MCKYVKAAQEGVCYLEQADLRADFVTPPKATHTHSNAMGQILRENKFYYEKEPMSVKERQALRRHTRTENRASGASNSRQEKGPTGTSAGVQFLSGT